MSTSSQDSQKSQQDTLSLNRRHILLSGSSLLALAAAGTGPAEGQTPAPATPAAAPSPSGKPNILVIWGDDVGQTNISAYGFGVVGYKTPNLDRLAKEGMMFTDY